MNKSSDFLKLLTLAIPTPKKANHYLFVEDGELKVRIFDGESCYTVGLDAEDMQKEPQDLVWAVKAVMQCTTS